MIYLLLFLLTTTSTTTVSPCGACEKGACPETTLDNCTTLASDECNCCQVCLRSEDETCGEGIGLCNEGLSCVSGICKDDQGRPDCSSVRCPQDVFNCAWDSVYVPGAPNNESCCQTPGECVCDISKCTPVACPEHYVKKLQSAGTGRPGQCCDIYQCEPDVKTPSTVCVDPLTGVKFDTAYNQSPCVRCHCYDGVPYCSNTTCPNVLCSNPIKRDDECCPRCETGGCSTDFKCSLDCLHGYSTDEKGCQVCECREKNQECGDPVRNCELNCPHKYALDKKGCEVCKCHECDSNKHCTLECGYGFQTDSRSCPMCSCKTDSNGHTLRPDQRQCVDGGMQYEDTETWEQGCRQCSCSIGVVDCGPIIDCDHLDCKNTFTQPGECCPVCVEECVDRSGDIRGEDDSWEEDCKTCTCTNGTITCHETVCQDHQCANSVYMPDQCCSLCSSVIDNEISDSDVDYTIALITKQDPHTITDRKDSFVDHLSVSLDKEPLFLLRLYFSIDLREINSKLSGMGSVVLVTVQQSGISADRVVKELRQSGVLPTKEPDIVDFMTYRGFMDFRQKTSESVKHRSKVSIGLIVGAVIISCIAAVGIILFGARRYMVLSDRRKFKHTAIMGQSADHLINAVNNNGHRLTINFGNGRGTSDQSADSTFSASPTPSDLVSPAGFGGHDNLASQYNPLSQVTE